MKKFVVGGIVLVLVTCGWGTMSVGQQRPAPRGELRIVDKSPANWQYITLNIVRAPRRIREGWHAGAAPGYRLALAR